MGQAFDEGDHFLGQARGESFKEVLDKLQQAHPHAHKVVIGHGEPPDVASAEMPRYKCHKEVWALKIRKLRAIPLDPVTHRERGLVIIPEDDGYAPFNVSAEYASKYNPQEGGYYVVYKDGYASFSPAQAFEEGYTRL